MNNKGLISTLAITLFLVTTAIAITGFSYWYLNFSGNVIHDYTGSTKAELEIKTLNSTALLVRSFSAYEFNYTNIKVGSSLCNISGSLPPQAITSVDITSCTTGISRGVIVVFILGDKSFHSQELGYSP